MQESGPVRVMQTGPILFDVQFIRQRLPWRLKTSQGNGDQTFFLKAGVYEMSFEGTLGGSTQIKLKAGGSSDGTNHVQVTDSAGNNIENTAGSHMEPELVQGGGYRTLTTSGFSGSSDLKVHFRRADAS